MITWERIILCDNPECRNEIARAPVRDADVQAEMLRRAQAEADVLVSSHLCRDCLNGF